ncbi:unnamed protein product [Paramecium sonneborni]|uniref:Uncharacterized protein n=1 Tax=Paramecium sonneborni TaxID=65129 RepID=A0A8S1RPT5_9CILI|nr:unnamed protein product [Paramecium sonneborni]
MLRILIKMKMLFYQRCIIKQDGKLQLVVGKAEPIQFIEEKVSILNPKTNQMQRKIQDVQIES